MEKHYDQRFVDVEEKVKLAKDNVDDLMRGFPDQYVKKGDASKLENKVDSLTYTSRSVFDKFITTPVTLILSQN